MHSPLPHYLLHAETYRAGRGALRWKFTLESIGGDERLAAAEAEPSTRRSRLELLAVVRGLEALDCPSRVTLLTRSQYVNRGIRRQLSQWREHGWQWERFGTRTPIRDYDLWRRIDRALEFHRVECRLWASGADAQQRSPSVATSGWLPAALEKLRRGIFTPLSAWLQPTFTRAA